VSRSSVSRRFFGVRIEAHPVVFPSAALLIIAFVIIAALYPARSLATFTQMKDWIETNFGWLYVLSMTGFLVLSLYLCFSKFGKVKLGRDGEEPEFGRLTWFSMLFSAGMGIGMLFWGVAEPMYHFNYPPDAEAKTLEAARAAMGITLFHWGLHPWALYALVGLSLAYFGFRRGLPLSFRSVFWPLFGDRIHGRLGDVIDILAVLATLFGLATSLGLGAKQVNAGLYEVFGLPMTTGMQIMLIACITGLAVCSLVSGLEVGIRRLSEINMCLAAFLLVFLFVMGPTLYLLGALVENTGAYVRLLTTNSFRTGVYDPEVRDWLGGWTIFYWGWWIAWSPFVGMFIARISRGRTIREFIGGALLVPTAVGILWMTGFGSTGLRQELDAEQVRKSEAAIVTGEGAAEEIEAPDVTAHVIEKSVQVKRHGRAQTLDGQWLVAPTATKVARPDTVLVKHSSEVPGLELQNLPKGVDAGGVYVTKESNLPVYYSDIGILRQVQTQEPYFPQSGERFYGQYKSERQELSLGQYLTASVITEDGTTQVDTLATVMFFMFRGYPLWWLTSMIATISVILFFVTSSDSASLVADIIASGGNDDPPVGTRLFWGILEGCLAAALLLAGGLVALQTGSITIGLPFCVLVILMCYSLMRGLFNEHAGEIPEEQAAHAAGELEETKAEHEHPTEEPRPAGD